MAGTEVSELLNKVCNKCGIEKSHTEFYSRTADCKPCHRIRVNSDKIGRKKSYLKYFHNITIEQFNFLFEEQKGCCAICSTHQTKLKRSLVVDHDHNTQQIRALLCSACNIGIGHLKDDPETTLLAYNYLKRFK